MDVYDIIGFSAAILVLFGYVQISRGSWRAQSYKFQLCNLVGAGALIVYGLHSEAYPNVLLNAVWLLIAAVAITKLKRQYRQG